MSSVCLGQNALAVPVPRGWHMVHCICSGEMQEWLNWTVSKTVVRATVPRVRIPLSPPSKKDQQLLVFFTSQGKRRIPLIVIIMLILYNSCCVQRLALEQLSARRSKELIAIFAAPTATFVGYLDHQRLLVLNENRRMLWIGSPEEPLHGIPIEQMPDPNNRPRSARLSRQRHFRTNQGDLTHVRSPNGWDNYLWYTGEGRRKRLAASRSQDFTFDYQEGDQLTVLPKERVLYCAGSAPGGCITAVTAVDDTQPESAEVFTGRSLSSLRRKMIYHPQASGSRLELRVGQNTLACGKDGMLLAGQALRMLDPESLHLELDNRQGLARLIRT